LTLFDLRLRPTLARLHPQLSWLDLDASWFWIFKIQPVIRSKSNPKWIEINPKMRILKL